MSKIIENTGIGGFNFSDKSRETLSDIFKRIMNRGIYGISFSAYIEGQGPGSQLSEEQIRRRMALIQPYVTWVRSFSCTEGNEIIPRIAHEFGLKTLVGAWIGDDEEKNLNEIDELIKVAKSGHADMIAVGNEVRLRGDLSEDAVVAHMKEVKNAVPDIPLGYVDAYYQFPLNPKITELCDVIMANCYPFWEGYPLEHALVYMKQMYAIAVKAANGKPVIITETGWPNIGQPVKTAAIPSYENALKYFINTYLWAEEDQVNIIYFSSFDETWKVDAEGDVGANWGLWDKDHKMKFV
ncbi:MAG: glycosyl hydrolase [FCB group bacterium]|nr:glycosyl hydrolase [FCB group bacterium]